MIVEISTKTEKRINRLMVILSKTRDEVIKEALRYKLKKSLGGDSDANLPRR